ncbi:hypothetical protein B296_00025006 [Ensete ventricosum]|uniref:4-alpha-glucanotransferase n=1 Tax=Ensete ventricosum TaxID=4639 RepID=A0A427AC44_ENSVE|nr:hypothetical protein B296_00025006 [Ensete ventricosum]
MLFLYQAAKRLLLSQGELKQQLNDFRKDPGISSKHFSLQSLFAAIDHNVNAFSWNEWPDPLKNRHLGALEDVYQKHKDFDRSGFPILVSGVPPDAFSETGQLWGRLLLIPLSIASLRSAGPGKAFFDAVFKAVGDIDIIAEDLGVITEDVVQLRKDIGAPGMAVLQFGIQ